MTTLTELPQEPTFAAPALAVLMRSGPLTVAEPRDATGREATWVDEEAFRAELEVLGDVVEFKDNERWAHVPSLTLSLLPERS